MGMSTNTADPLVANAVLPSASPSRHKRTELGAITSDWDVKSLGQCLLHPPRYGINAAAVPFDDALPTYIRITDISENGCFSPAPKVSVAHWQAAEYVLEEGDIVVARTGASVGKSYCYDSNDGTLIFAGFLIQIKPDPNLLRPEFLKQYLQTGAYWNWVATMSARSGQPGINGKEYGSLLLPLPPTTDEQDGIAKALSDVDALIGALEKLIAKKRAIKQAAMQQLLTGKTRLPGFTGEWSEHQVKDVIARYFCGPSPTCIERNVEGGEWGVLKTTAATKEHGWDWRKHKVLPHLYWGRDDLALRKDDVIITKAGPRHRVGVAAAVDYVPDNVIVSGKMIGLRPDPVKVDSLMLAGALNRPDTQAYLNQRTTGMAESQVNFENTALLTAPITLPPRYEQSSIATVLSDMDAEIAAIEQRRDKTQKIKQGMMQQLLTGRVRLVKPNTDRQKEPA